MEWRGLKIDHTFLMISGGKPENMKRLWAWCRSNEKKIRYCRTESIGLYLCGNDPIIDELKYIIEHNICIIELNYQFTKTSTIKL